jgi:hypothetical protein
MNKIRTGLASPAVLLVLDSPAWSQAPAKPWDAKRFPEIEKARRHIDKADELPTEMSAYYAVGS